MASAAIIHIGVSKTGTTTLQRNVFPQLEGILFLGKPGPHAGGYVVPGFSKYCSALLEYTLTEIVDGRPYPTNDVQALATVISNLKNSGTPVVFSDEYLSGNRHTDFRDIALALREIFGPAELLVTVRDPLTALPSLYWHEMLRFPELTPSFTKWLDDAIVNPRHFNRPGESLEQYRYGPMLEQFRTVFDDNISVLRYEDLVADVSGFARGLARVIGADAEAIEKLLHLPPQNATQSDLSYRYRRFVDKLSMVKPLQRFKSAAFLMRLHETLEQWTAKGPKKTIVLSDHDRARIAEFFPYELPAWVDEINGRNTARQGASAAQPSAERDADSCEIAARQS